MVIIGITFSVAGGTWEMGVGAVTLHCLQCAGAAVSIYLLNSPKEIFELYI